MGFLKGTNEINFVQVMSPGSKFTEPRKIFSDNGFWHLILVSKNLNDLLKA